MGTAIRVLAMLGAVCVSVPAWAQPAGWSNQVELAVHNPNPDALAQHQVRVVLDTAAMVAAGTLEADGADLRFGADAEGALLLPYWIESGIDTTETIVWVRMDSLPASSVSRLWVFHGNPGASSASTVEVFDFESQADNSATQQVSGGAPGGVPDSQRGFRFRPREDVVLISLGKNEPNGTARVLTLFDWTTQDILVQQEVSGAAATYSYADVPAPRMLHKDQVYTLQMHQGASDGYYYGAGPQMSPRLEYLDMRYCNGCDASTFPANYLSAIHYGYPDFLFRTRKQAAAEPQVLIPPVAISMTLSATPDPADFMAPVELRAQASIAVDGSVDFLVDGAVYCDDAPLVAGVATCMVPALAVGDVPVSVQFAGGDLLAAAAADTVMHVQATLPGAPRNLVAIPEDGAAWIHADPPENGGGVPLTRYTVLCSDGVLTFGALAPTPPLLVGGLSNHVTYGCSMTATNAVGEGPATAVLLVTPPLDRLFVDGFEADSVQPPGN